MTGQLSLADGSGIPNRSVEIDAEEKALTTLETNPDGRINETLLLPESIANEESVNLSARFEGTGTNLAPTQSQASVAVTTGGFPSWLWPLVGVVIVLIAIAGILVLSRRQSGIEKTGPVAGIGSDADAIPEYESNVEPERLLSAAKECLSEEDTEGAVRLAYAAARAAVSGPEYATHWEFYQACATDQISEETVAALRKVTEGYEQVNYTATSISAPEAEQLVSAVTSMTKSGEQ
jgi:hypothetical protein